MSPYEISTMILSFLLIGLAMFASNWCGAARDARESAAFWRKQYEAAEKRGEHIFKIAVAALNGNETAIDNVWSANAPTESDTL